MEKYSETKENHVLKLCRTFQAIFVIQILGWVTCWSSPASAYHSVPVEIILSNRPTFLSTRSWPGRLGSSYGLDHKTCWYLIYAHNAPNTLLLTKKWKKISWEACPYRPSRAGSWYAFYYSLFPNNTNAMANPLSHLCHKDYWLFTFLMFIFRWTEYQWHALIKWTKWW